MRKAQKLARQILEKNKTRSWREISEQDYEGKIHFATLNKIANSNGAYIPSDKAAQYLLGLYKPRPITPNTMHNNEAAQSWTLYMRHLIKSNQVPTPKNLIRKNRNDQM